MQPKLYNNEEVCRILTNKDDYGLYDGNLVAFYDRMKKYAPNYDYHNLVHIGNVLSSFSFWSKRYFKHLLRSDVKIGLYVAIGHDAGYKIDYRHHDRLNTFTAMKLTRQNLPHEDWKYFHQIAEGIDVTTFPYDVPNSEISLLLQMIRISDTTISLFDESFAGLRTVKLLAREWGVSLLDALETQEPHYVSLLESGGELIKDPILQMAISQKMKEVRWEIRNCKNKMN